MEHVLYKILATPWTIEYTADSRSHGLIGTKPYSCYLRSKVWLSWNEVQLIPGAIYLPIYRWRNWAMANFE